MSDDFQSVSDMDVQGMFAHLKPRTDAEMAEYEARQRERHGKIRWTRCSVPTRHRQVIDAGRFIKTPELAKNLQVIAGLPDGYVIGLFGLRGTGKSQLAVQAIYDRCMQDRSARYTTLPDLMAALQETWDGPTKLTQEQALRPFLQCSLLVLDEIGDRTGGAWDTNLITRIVDVRYREMLDTILIGNVEAQELNTKLPSVMRRIYETSGVLAMNTPILKLLQGAA